MTRAEDALAQALIDNIDWPNGDYPARRVIWPGVVVDIPDQQHRLAAAIIAALPPDVAIVSVAEVAERLAAYILSDWNGDNEVLPWATLPSDARATWAEDARRLLGLDEPPRRVKT